MRTVFGETKAQHVHTDFPCYLLWLYTKAHNSIGKARTIHMHFQPVFFCCATNILDLCRCIDRTQLCGLGETQCAAFWKV